MPGLYVHVPFCLRKCAYCAFYSVPLPASGLERAEVWRPDGKVEPAAAYLKGVAREIRRRSDETSAEVSSLYLGGGTPTALSRRQLDQLLKMIHQHFVFSPSEKTTEANPGTLDQEKLAVLRAYGINRISLGAQSFNDQLLRRIGRIHRAEDIGQAVARIRKAGIGNLNLDLILGLPGQTLADWQDTLSKAVRLSPEHLSVYALTLEEGTPLGEKYLPHPAATSQPEPFSGSCPEKLPDDDLQADMYDWAVDFLRGKGYKRYETSNFAKPGYECRHNLSYWRGEDYIGLGPGAVSCLGNIRSKNVEDILLYFADQGKEAGQETDGEREYLSLKQRMSEYMMLGLRTEEGVDLTTFSRKFRADVRDIYGQIMANYIDRDILFVTGGRLKVRPEFFFVANAIIKDFIL